MQLSRNTVLLYRVASWVLLGFGLYLLALPIFSPAMHELLPSVWTCAYRRATGTPCPFCGITTELGALFFGRAASAHNPLTIPIAALVLFEIGWRALVIWRFRVGRPLAKLFAADVGIHALLALGMPALVLSAL